jgi:hypothetical protein
MSSVKAIPYRNGTIKLTWINPSDYSILESSMHPNLQDALSNLPKSKGNNWLVFQLVESDGVKYKWKLLPYGKYRGYINGMKLRDNPLLKYGAIALMLYGAYSLYKMIMVE